MADVFISYSSEDRDRVRPLAEALEKRGLEVWWDRALAAGDDYANVIAKALEEAKAVIVVWTRVSVDSSWVRDEAARARDSGRLAPVLFDKVQIPLGFGAINAEDFTAWNGSAAAAQIELLEESLRARIEGRAPDGGRVQSKRKRLGARVRLVSALTALAVAAAGIGGVLTILNQSKPAPVVAEKPATDSLSQMLELVNQGKITGDQAVELAKLLQQQAFADVPTPPAEPVVQAAPEAPGAAAGPQENTTISAAEAKATAESSFADAAAKLLQDPDPEVRMAALQAAKPATRTAGLDKLWMIAQTGPASAETIWTFCAALGLVTGDARAPDALERARQFSPQDTRLWKMLSYAYGQQEKSAEARGAALVGDGLEKAASGNEAAAATALQQAMPLLSAQSKAFVLGQLGDAEAKKENWAAAAKHYKGALDLHVRAKNVAGIGVDAPKLARALATLGDKSGACRTLRRAEEQGAETIKPLAEEMCAPSAPPVEEAPAPVSP